MTGYLVVWTGGMGAPAEIPAAAVAALAPKPWAPPALHSDGAFACAAVPGPQGPPTIHLDGRVVVVGDVRLDARDELRRRLRAQAPDGTAAVTPAAGQTAPVGRGSRDETDLALVAAAYTRWGAGALDRIRGDFSFVLYDRGARRLLAARDGLGVRPLYHAHVGSGLVLGNVLSAVRATPGVAAALRPEAVVSFLIDGWNRDLATTTFAAIDRLPPGMALEASSGASVRRWRHWTIPDPDPVRFRTERQYAEQYRAVLGAAVRDRVDCGATTLLLSGGIDSPTIAAAARDAVGPDTIQTVTLREPAVESDEEARLASAVARRLGLAHRTLTFAADPTPEAPRRTPEPYDDPEFERFCTTVRDDLHGARVVIEGEDGDALFAPPGVADMVRREPASRVIVRLLLYALRHRRKPYVGFWLARRIGLRGQRREGGGPPPWLTPRARQTDPPREAPPLRDHARPDAVARLTGSIWQSVHDGLAPAYHGSPIEWRFPLLDTRLLEFVWAVPPVPWCQDKFLARRAYERDLPRAVIARRKTTVPGYFEALVAAWRARTGASVAPLHDVTREYVDEAALAQALAVGGVESVLGAWRAVQFDAWVRAGGAT